MHRLAMLVAACLALGSSHALAQDLELAANTFSPSRPLLVAGGIGESLTLQVSASSNAGTPSPQQTGPQHTNLDAQAVRTHRRHVGLVSMGSMLALGGLGASMGSLFFKDDGIRNPNTGYVAFNFVTAAIGLGMLIHSAIQLRHQDVSLDIRRRHRRRIIPAALLILVAHAGFTFATFFAANIDGFSS